MRRGMDGGDSKERRCGEPFYVLYFLPRFPRCFVHPILNLTQSPLRPLSALLLAGCFPNCHARPPPSHAGKGCPWSPKTPSNVILCVLVKRNVGNLSNAASVSSFQRNLKANQFIIASILCVAHLMFRIQRHDVLVPHFN